MIESTANENFQKYIAAFGSQQNIYEMSVDIRGLNNHIIIFMFARFTQSILVNVFVCIL